MSAAERCNPHANWQGGYAPARTPITLFILSQGACSVILSGPAHGTIVISILSSNNLKYRYMYCCNYCCRYMFGY